MWGTFESFEPDDGSGEKRIKEIHVIPCDRDGYVLWPHETTWNCRGQPKMDPEYPQVVIHIVVS